MSFDGLFTHAIINELNHQLQNGRINKIQQPYEQEIILVIRSHGKNYKLLLSAHPSYARIQITALPFVNPVQPPNFCMMLRKYLEGAILTNISQVENDRIIHFDFRTRDELGDTLNLQLIVELMGRHSNIILINKESNKILDCIKHIGMSQNSYRTLLPGADYILPPQQVEQQNPWTISDEKLFAVLNKASELTPRYLQQHFQGIGKDSAEDLCQYLMQATHKVPAWHQWFDTLKNPKPTLITNENKQWFVPMDYISIQGDRQYFTTCSDLLDAYYEDRAEKDRVRQQMGALLHRLTQEKKKNEAKIPKLEKSLRDADNAEKWRQYGELLTTFLHQVPRGAKEVTLPNYYENDQPVTIPLNPAYSPNLNAQKYFQKYQKLKKGVHIVETQLEQTEQEVQYLDSIIGQLEIATPLDLEVIREELIAEGYIKEKRKHNKKTTKSQPARYQSSDGTIIRVGKNNLQNDQLTLKTANKNHYWLHAKNIPGSHVIIESDYPSDETLNEAAQLAAYFSKYQHSANVPVDYIQVKHIRKPNGSKPGFVVYEGQKTLYVTPNKELIEKMKID